MFHGEKITKVKKKVKARLPKKTNLLKVACEWAQLYAKLIETDADGNGECVSCGRKFNWFSLSGGHYQPKGRNYNGACLDERNVHIQDSGCNLYLGGNPAGYTAFMLNKYGEKVIDEIKQKSYKIHDRFEVIEYIRRTVQVCKELAKDKTFKVNFPPIPNAAR